MHLSFDFRGNIAALPSCSGEILFYFFYACLLAMRESHRNLAAVKNAERV